MRAGNKEWTKKVLSALLSASMALSLCPAAYAAGSAETLPQAEAGKDAYVYGTLDLPYADFFYGELNDVEENAALNLAAQDAVSLAHYREKGQYDAVSSATTTKSKRFGATYYEETDSGVELLGIKDVNVAVPQKLYDAAKEAIAEKKPCSNPLLDFVGQIKLADPHAAAPAEYKVLNGDGTLTAMVTEQKTDSAASASITTDSVWGDYQISISSESLPTTEDMLGVVVETASGQKYGMAHLENLWLRTGEIAFAVTDGFVEPHGNTIDSERHKGLVGETITKITYLIKDKEDLVIETNLKCKQLLEAGYGAAGSDALYAEGASSSIEIKAPQDSNYALFAVTFAGNVLDSQTDYSYQDHVLTIHATEHTGIGQYTLTFTDDTYEDMSVSVVFASDYAEGSIAIKDNKLVLPQGLSLTAYLNSISGVSVNGTPLRVRGNIGEILFQKDGTVNFDAKISGREGETAVFPDADAEYTLALTAIGYPSVTATVTPRKAGGDSPEPGVQAPGKGEILTYQTEKYKVTKPKSAVAYVSTDSKATALRIPAAVTIGGYTYKVTSIEAGAFKNKKNITSATIGNYVATIGKAAFSGCTKLEQVTMGAGVKKVGDSAFYHCAKLKSIALGKNVTSIGTSAFHYCTGLKSITLGANVTSIGNSAFKNCTKLKSVILGANIKSIGTSAFSNCTGLKSITLGAKVATIGASAFSGCKSLQSATLGTGVKKVGKEAFKGDSKLAKIIIKSAKLSAVGKNAFKGISAKAKIKVPQKLLKKYQKLLKSKGQGKKVTITK